MIDKELLILRILRRFTKNRLEMLESVIIIKEKNNFIRKLLLGEVKWKKD